MSTVYYRRSYSHRRKRRCFPPSSRWIIKYTQIEFSSERFSLKVSGFINCRALRIDPILPENPAAGCSALIVANIIQNVTLDAESAGRFPLMDDAPLAASHRLPVAFEKLSPSFLSRALLWALFVLSVLHKPTLCAKSQPLVKLSVGVSIKSTEALTRLYLIPASHSRRHSKQPRLLCQRHILSCLLTSLHLCSS